MSEEKTWRRIRDTVKSSYDNAIDAFYGYLAIEDDVKGCIYRYKTNTFILNLILDDIDKITEQLRLVVMRREDKEREDHD